MSSMLAPVKTCRSSVGVDRAGSAPTHTWVGGARMAGPANADHIVPLLTCRPAVFMKLTWRALHTNTRGLFSAGAVQHGVGLGMT